MISRQVEAGHDQTAGPFATADWLSPTPGRHILVTGTYENTTTGSVDQLVEEILRRDTPNLGTNNDDRENSGRPSALEYYPGDPFALPYDSGRFDLVIVAFLSSRVEIKRELLQEFGRVIRPDGHLLIIDNLVPGSRLRGKKARQLRLAGEYVNAWMKLRNPQHNNYLSQDSWNHLLADCNWKIQQTAMHEIPHDFYAWVDCFSPSTQNRLRLQAMLVQAPEKVYGFLTPVESGDRIAFRLTEIFILATMAKKTE